MGIIAWIIFGGLAGWVASLVTGANGKMGLVANVLAGVSGAFIGGFIMNYFNKAGVTGFNLRSFGVAVLGSIILIFIFKLILK